MSAERARLELGDGVALVVAGPYDEGAWLLEVRSGPGAVVVTRVWLTADQLGQFVLEVGAALAR